MLEDPLSENCRGEQRREHGEYMAKELLGRGLSLFEISATEAKSFPQNNLKKQPLVWLIKRHTVVTGEWIRKELDMGSRANVTRALQRYDHSTEKEIKRIKRRMTQCAVWYLFDPFSAPFSIIFDGNRKVTESGECP